jgi:hypothetical protein
MQQSNESGRQLQQLIELASPKWLIELASPKWLVELVPLIWRLVAAVRLFFQPRDYAAVDGPI